MTTLSNNSNSVDYNVRDVSVSDELPKQFLSSLRILFDILDENQTGFIRLKDIESRWSDDGVKGLPAGVVDGLKKVTPSNGLLSFERFVTGLKLALTVTKKQAPFTAGSRKPLNSKENLSPVKHSDRTHPFTSSNEFNYDRTISDNKTQHHQFYRHFENVPYKSKETAYWSSVSNPNLNHKITENQKQNFGSETIGAEYGPFISGPQSKNNSITNSRPASTVVKSVDNHYNGNNQSQNYAGHPPVIPPRNAQPPAPRSRSSQIRKSQSGPSLQTQSSFPPTIPPRDVQSSTRVVNELKSWQREWATSQPVDKTVKKYDQTKYGQDGMIYANIEEFQKKPIEQNVYLLKASVRRHGSGRRHTLANGIDQNMLKRMKQLEEETSILRSGLAMVDKAREWYLKQIQSVTDKQAMLEKVKLNDNSVDAHQEKINFQQARITEANKHIQALIESSEKGFPLHMNLALSGVSTFNGNNPLIQTLKDQNRGLHEDLKQKKELIIQLEKEKSTLVRELFEARSKNKTNFDDTTFM